MNKHMCCVSQDTPRMWDSREIDDFYVVLFQIYCNIYLPNNVWRSYFKTKTVQFLPHSVHAGLSLSWAQPKWLTRINLVTSVCTWWYLQAAVETTTETQQPDEDQQLSEDVILASDVTPADDAEDKDTEGQQQVDDDVEKTESAAQELDQPPAVSDEEQRDADAAADDDDVKNDAGKVNVNVDLYSALSWSHL